MSLDAITSNNNPAYGSSNYQDTGASSLEDQIRQLHEYEKELQALKDQYGDEYQQLLDQYSDVTGSYDDYLNAHHEKVTKHIPLIGGLVKAFTKTREGDYEDKRDEFMQKLQDEGLSGDFLNRAEDLMNKINDTTSQLKQTTDNLATSGPTEISANGVADAFIALTDQSKVDALGTAGQDYSDSANNIGTDGVGGMMNGVNNALNNAKSFMDDTSWYN